MKVIWLTIFLGISATSCLKNSNNFNQTLQNQIDDQKIQTYLSQHSITAIKDSSSGLYYRIDSLGSGDSVKLMDTVTVKFIGSFLDGTVFDQTPDTAATAFVLDDSVIQAFQIGLPKIRVGGGIELFCPSVLGYGYYGYPPVVPSNTDLIFKVQLLGVRHY